jgi:aspartyl protease
MWATPFEYLHHLVTVPVVAGERPTRFVFDSGIGLTLLSESFAATIGCGPNGRSFTGRRMSGQEVTTPLGSLDSLTFGTTRREQLEVGLFDTSVFPPGFEELGGFLSLEFFEHAPVTVDYPAGTIVLEDEESLSARAASGTVLDVQVERTGIATDVFLPFDVAGQRGLSLEVDMGSDCLILDERYATLLGVDVGGEDVRRVDGEDETGHAYTRTFATLAGALHPSGAPGLSQVDPAVMFQQIIHDGLIGDSFLRNFAVTYDVANARMIFA